MPSAGRTDPRGWMMDCGESFRARCDRGCDGRGSRRPLPRNADADDAGVAARLAFLFRSLSSVFFVPLPSTPRLPGAAVPHVSEKVRVKLRPFALAMAFAKMSFLVRGSVRGPRR